MKGHDPNGGKTRHRMTGSTAVKPGPGARSIATRLVRKLPVFIAGAVAICLVNPGPAAARKLPAQNPAAVEAARVTDVVDGDTIRLETGAEVRLTGIQAPKLPLGRKGFRAWPLAGDAKAALAAIIGNRELRLDYTGRRHDRWGRLLAHVYAGTTWLQQEMLLRGLARVYTFSDNRAHAAALYAAERKARSAGRGIWAMNWYRIRRAERADSDIGTFQLVEGKVMSTAIVRGRAYLNFGEDWRTDFTVSISPKHMKLFRAASIDIMDLRERRIRVRGWLVRRNGAMISVTHPEQIEILTE